VRVDETELRIDVTRQANFVPTSAVRVTHLPTGLTAEAVGTGELQVRRKALTDMEAALAETAKLARFTLGA